LNVINRIPLTKFLSLIRIKKIPPSDRLFPVYERKMFLRSLLFLGKVILRKDNDEYSSPTASILSKRMVKV
jgi:hypothetical protein